MRTLLKIIYMRTCTSFMHMQVCIIVLYIVTVLILNKIREHHQSCRSQSDSDVRQQTHMYMHEPANLNCKCLGNHNDKICTAHVYHGKQSMSASCLALISASFSPVKYSGGSLLISCSRYLLAS